MAENKIRIEDHAGNTFYPHTKAEVVFTADGKTVESQLNENASLIHTKVNTVNPIIEGKLTLKSINFATGIEGNLQDGASYEKCNMDIFSWQGIGMYPVSGGLWGDGMVGRSIVFNPREGKVIARGGFFVGETGDLKRVATTENMEVLTANLLNGWATIGDKFRISKVSNVVTLRGMFDGGVFADGTPLFVLPEKYRPTGELYYTSTYGSGVPRTNGAVVVGIDGAIRLYHMTNSSGLIINWTFNI